MCFYTRPGRLIGHSVKVHSATFKKKKGKKKRKCKGQEQKNNKKKTEPPEELTLSNFERIIYLQTYHYFPRETCLFQWDENQAVLSGRVFFFFF